MPPTERKPNWEVWANVPAWTAWEAVALSLDIDPKKVKLNGNAWMSADVNSDFPHQEGRTFDDRLIVLRRNLSSLQLHKSLSHRPDYSELNAGDFVRWALSLKWTIPPEMAALADRPSPKPERRQIDKVQDLTTTERNSLLKLVIGMAVGGYGYDPSAARSTSAPDIVADLEKAGVRLEADTVRKYLKEAAELLPGGKTTGKP